MNDLEPEDYTRFQQDLTAWINRNPEQMSLRFGAISDLAIEHMDLDEDANLYTGISYEQGLLRELRKSKGGGLFTGKLESSLQQTNIEVKEIELEMQRIADHLEWFPIYTSWVLQLTAIDYAERGPLVENLAGLKQLEQLGTILEAQQGMADALTDLATSQREFEPLAIKALQAIGKIDTHIERIESALKKHEEHIGQTGNALEQIAVVLTNRTTLISLAVITGASMGVAFMFCILVYKTFGERRKGPKD